MSGGVIESAVYREERKHVPSSGVDRLAVYQDQEAARAFLYGDAASGAARSVLCCCQPYRSRLLHGVSLCTFHIGIDPFF
jgi:hypothetical protein